MVRFIESTTMLFFECHGLNKLFSILFNGKFCDCWPLRILWKAQFFILNNIECRFDRTWHLKLQASFLQSQSWCIAFFSSVTKNMLLNRLILKVMKLIETKKTLILRKWFLWFCTYTHIFCALDIKIVRVFVCVCVFLVFASGETNSNTKYPIW